VFVLGWLKVPSKFIIIDLYESLLFNFFIKLGLVVYLSLDPDDKLLLFLISVNFSLNNFRFS